MNTHGEYLLLGCVCVQWACLCAMSQVRVSEHVCRWPWVSVCVHQARVYRRRRGFLCLERIVLVWVFCRNIQVKHQAWYYKIKDKLLLNVGRFGPSGQCATWELLQQGSLDQSSPPSASALSELKMPSEKVTAPLTQWAHSGWVDGELGLCVKSLDKNKIARGLPPLRLVLCRLRQLWKALMKEIKFKLVWKREVRWK